MDAEAFGRRPGEDGKVAMPKTITLGNLLTMVIMVTGGLSVAAGGLWSAASWKEHNDTRLSQVEDSVKGLATHLSFIDEKLGGQVWMPPAKK